MKSSILSEITGNINNRMSTSTSSSLLADSIDIPTSSSSLSYLKHSSSMNFNTRTTNHLLNSQSAYALTQHDIRATQSSTPTTTQGRSVRAIRGTGSSVLHLVGSHENNTMSQSRSTNAITTSISSCTNDLYRSYLCLKLLEQQNNAISK